MCPRQEQDHHRNGSEPYGKVPVNTPEVESVLVSELCHIPRETPRQHRHLRAHVYAHRCCGKSSVGSALVGFGVRQRAREELLSKRAP
jgi:hypothetical protein